MSILKNGRLSDGRCKLKDTDSGYESVFCTITFAAFQEFLSAANNILQILEIQTRNKIK